EFKQVYKGLDEYTHRFTIQAMVVKNPPNFHENEFELRRLTVAETQAEIGGFYLWSHDVEAARAPIRAALNENPQIGLAHENMGLLDFADGKDQDAVHEFDQAFQLDGKLYLSAYYRAMLSPAAHSDLAADQAGFHDAMVKVLDLNPQFAPAFIQRARLDLRQ